MVQHAENMLHARNRVVAVPQPGRPYFLSCDLQKTTKLDYGIVQKNYLGHVCLPEGGFCASPPSPYVLRLTDPVDT